MMKIERVVVLPSSSSPTNFLVSVYVIYYIVVNTMVSPLSQCSLSVVL